VPAKPAVWDPAGDRVSSAGKGRPSSLLRRVESDSSDDHALADPDPPPGRITVATEEDRVLVRTFAADESPAELPFNFLVAC